MKKRTDRRLRYAMVGGAKGSFIGPIHRMALRMDDLADLVAGCFSRNAKRNAESGAAFGLDPARVYADGKALVAAEQDKIDFLVVCTTNESHYALAKAALEAGIDVFCEKPLSLTVDEAAELGRIARRRHLVLGIPFTYTGYPMVKLARDLVRKGELGRIDKVVMEYQQGSFRKSDRRNGWKMNPKIAGPSCVVADIGVHAFAIIEYVTGLEVKSLLADLTSFASGGLDDDASVLMRLGQRSGGGAEKRSDRGNVANSAPKAALVVSKIATGEENGLRFRIYGDKASLAWDQEEPNRLLARYPTGPDRIYRRKAPCIGAYSEASLGASRFPAGHPEGFVEALANVYDGFVEAVKTRDPGDFPGEAAGIRSMRFVEACLKSAKTGSGWVRL